MPASCVGRGQAYAGVAVNIVVCLTCCLWIEVGVDPSDVVPMEEAEVGGPPKPKSAEARRLLSSLLLV